MTIITYGYAGEVDEIAYAESNILSGVRYGVSNFADFRPTAGGAGDRAVTIAAGEAMGGGVRAVNSAPVVLNHASVGAGSRWDLIVLRRDWAAGTATLVIITGSSAKTLPPRNTDVGTLDDQPIALVRVAAGSSVVAEVVDLRVFAGDGGLFALDELVMQYGNHRAGTTIRINDRLWCLVIDSGGSHQWRRFDVQADTGWVDATRNGGWSWGICQVRRIGGIVFFRIAATRSSGWAPGNQLAVLPVGFRPTDESYCGNQHHLGNGKSFRITSDGQVTASNDSAGATGVSLWGSFPAPITN